MVFKRYNQKNRGANTKNGRKVFVYLLKKSQEGLIGKYWHNQYDWFWEVLEGSDANF